MTPEPLSGERSLHRLSVYPVGSMSSKSNIAVCSCAHKFTLNWRGKEWRTVEIFLNSWPSANHQGY